MAKMNVRGFQEFLDQLVRAGQASGKVTGVALYEGVKVVADELRAQTEDLPVDRGKKKKDGKNSKRGLTAEEKQGLLERLGSSTARKTGADKNIVIGFGGYSSHKTETWKQGVPNALVARSVDRGTSFMRATHFLSRTARLSKDRAEAAMKEAAEAELRRIFTE